MTKYDKLQTAYRIEYRITETNQVDENTVSEQLRFYISPIYLTKQAVSDRIKELQAQENYYDGVVISLKNIPKK
jgi:hypothetical protein